jgi:dTDP-4-dehydrorhamnose 3,5-epimerase-like enzyme
MKPFFQFSLPEFSDERGALIPIEFDKDFPIKNVKRVYFLHNTPSNMTRGAHCHFIEEEVFVCIKRKCSAPIAQRGTEKKEILLDNPTKAIFVGTKVWHEFIDFSEDAILLCFSSTHYLPGEENYELDYKKFLALHA